jgi:hypothetical protein
MLPDFRTLSLPGFRHAARGLAALLLVAACDPVPNFYGRCDAFDPPCSAREYRLVALRHVPGAGSPLVPPDSNGVVRLPALPATFSLYELQMATACRPRAGGSLAWATSCIGCTSYFKADSVFFTTDFIGPGGDTLKAGTALDTANLPSGIRFRGREWVELDSGATFRDSLFELRLHGKVDGAPKNATLRVEVPGSLRAL